MIPRITKGRSAYGALRYDYGPGRREEHSDAREVAGNMAGTWKDKAALIDEHARYRSDVRTPVWRSSLRAAPEDRALSDEEWGRVARQYVHQMGYKDAPWTATRHGEDHVHVTVSRVDWSGKLVSDGHDYARAQSACRRIEREHRLVDASARYNRSAPQVSHGERESATRREVAPERVQLRGLLSGAERESAGTRQGYEAALEARGVRYAAATASTGRISGYRYALEGHTDAEGSPVWFKGSQISREHSWAKTAKRLEAVRQPKTSADVRAERDSARERAAARVQALRAQPQDQRRKSQEGTPMRQKVARENGNDLENLAQPARGETLEREGARQVQVRQEQAGPSRVGQAGEAAEERREQQEGRRTRPTEAEAETARAAIAQQDRGLQVEARPQDQGQPEPARDTSAERGQGQRPSARERAANLVQRLRGQHEAQRPPADTQQQSRTATPAPGQEPASRQVPIQGEEPVERAAGPARKAEPDAEGQGTPAAEKTSKDRAREALARVRSNAERGWER